jgi:fluoroquinolone resistance protein
MLAMCQFTGADCFGIELRKCDLKGANFQRANFANHISHKAYFCSAFITGCNLIYANFERALLEKCELFENRWNGANLFGASFLGSDLSSGEFSSEQWGTFNMEQCDLTHVDLEGLNLRRVSMTGVKICDWQQAQLLEPFGLVVV